MVLIQEIYQALAVVETEFLMLLADLVGGVCGPINLYLISLEAQLAVSTGIALNQKRFILFVYQELLITTRVV